MNNCPDYLQPLDQSQIKSAAVAPNLNYTNQDFSSLKTRLVSYTQEKFGDKFNDFIEGSLAIMLLENVAFIADMLSFKQDQIANEVFIDTVAEIENAFRLSSLVGFQPTPPIASTAMFSLVIQSPLVTDLIIPGGLRFDLSVNGTSLYYEIFQGDSSKNPIFDEDIVIPAGNISNTNVVGVEGRTVSDSFTASGDINQTFTLVNFPVLSGSIRVDVDGQRWQQVDYFTDGGGRNEYRIEYTSAWVAYIIFGNGRAGRSPGSGSNVLVTYRIGGGPRGNIITGAINTQRGITVPGLNFSVPVTIRNYTKGDFGYVGDGIEDIRRKLPAWVKTQDRAVTANDYKTLSELYASPYNGQVGKALAALRNQGCAGNIVDLFVLSRDGDSGLKTASTQLKDEVGNYIDGKKIMTHFVCVRDGVIVLVDITLDVTVDKFYKKYKDEIDKKLRNRITSFFSLSNWEYGQNLKDSQLIRSLAMPEVIDVDVSFSTSDPNNGGSNVSVKYYEIIRPDNLIVNVSFN
jgi:hypothetical protein